VVHPRNSTRAGVLDIGICWSSAPYSSSLYGSTAEAAAAAADKRPRRSEPTLAASCVECGCMNFTMEIASLAIAGFGVLIAAVGVPLLYAQLRLQNRQRKLELGNFYIQRFWEIDDAMLREPKGTDSHRRERHRYLRLCEDEYDAARYGWLDRLHWSIWHEWLTSTKGASNLRSDLEACDPEENGFPSIRACLAQLKNETQPHSVEACEALTTSPGIRGTPRGHQTGRPPGADH